ncbi:SDR family NAD(P)-dependent oxidoreductase [Kitasatospora sp. NPDC101183]|uniref:SDR family NAD(P)-dependent oxidoreductase n=1 Tax=Kitasatospora sp. NPDC101183 TaxID=3364100 RepID=UPI00380148E1
MAGVTGRRLAVVSGGGSGIGRAIAARLVADGHRVVVLGRRAAVLERAAQEIGGPVTPLPGDLTDPAAVEHLAARIAELGPVDVLVNNAGATVTPPEDDSLAALAGAWRRDLDANLLTAVLLTTALQPHLARPGGRLVVISSAAAQRGGSGPHSAGSYAAAKAALHGWAFGLARQLGPDGVTVNVLAPGYVQDTEIFGEGWSEDFHARKVADTLVGRAGTPEDVAEAVAYLASPAAGYLTGQVIGLNGGAVLGR